jgi:hypothetical protein
MPTREGYRVVCRPRRTQRGAAWAAEICAGFLAQGTNAAEWVVQVTTVRERWALRKTSSSKMTFLGKASKSHGDHAVRAPRAKEPLSCRRRECR